MRLALAVEAPREEIARVGGRVAIGLTGDDDTSFLRVDDERLMAGRVARSRDDPHALRDLGILVAEELEGRAREGDRLVRQRVVEGRRRGVALDAPHEDRLSR